MKTTKREIVTIEFTGDEIAVILVEHTLRQNHHLHDYEVTSYLGANASEEVSAQLTFEGTPEE